LPEIILIACNSSGIVLWLDSPIGPRPPHFRGFMDPTQVWIAQDNSTC